MGERLTWDEIVKKYPHQWVVLDELDFEKGSSVNFKTAIVVRTASDEEIKDLEVQYLREGKKYRTRRTADEMNVGVIDCENYKIGVITESK